MTLLSPQAAYELWAGTYPAIAHNPLMRLEQEIVEPLIGRLPAKRALDVGSGSGRYLPVLEATGATIVPGLDFSLAMLLRSEGRARVCGDACRLPFSAAAFDLVNASLMVGDVADLEGWMREMARVLARGGHLVYSDFHPSWAQQGWSRTFRAADGAMHAVSFNPHALDDHLAAIARAGLRVVAIREPRFSDDRDPSIKAFRRRWGNPPVVVVFHTVKDR